MLKLLAAPVTNDRSPRYMERALAAIHQAHAFHEPITFRYAATGGRVGLFVDARAAVASTPTAINVAKTASLTLPILTLLSSNRHLTDAI